MLNPHEALRTVEIFQDPAILGLLAVAFGMAFTQHQKEYIRDRDGRCMFPEPHDCNGKEKTLQVHHVIPQRYAEAIGIGDADYPENGISLCEHAHQRMVHPDMAEALDAYRKGDKTAFHKAFEKRDEMLAERKTYWVTKWDRIFHAIAIRNQQRANKEGKEFPLSKKQIKEHRLWLSNAAAD